MAGTQRYWDGINWTDHVAPLVDAAPAPAPAQAPVGRTANGMQVLYNRQQKGHSLTKHLLLGWALLYIPTIYYAASPNHYFHA